MNYEQKYLKYKIKYRYLKQNILKNDTIDSKILNKIQEGGVIPIELN